MECVWEANEQRAEGGVVYHARIQNGNASQDWDSVVATSFLSLAIQSSKAMMVSWIDEAAVLPVGVNRCQPFIFCNGFVDLSRFQIRTGQEVSLEGKIVSQYRAREKRGNRYGRCILPQGNYFLGRILSKQ